MKSRSLPRVRYLAVGTAALAVLGSLAVPARAVTVPAAITATSCQADPGGIFQRIDGTGSCVLATALVSFVSSPFVNLSVEASSVGFFLNGVHAAAAQASLQYFFEVTGGNPGDEVPLLIATNLSTLATGIANDSARASILVTSGFGSSLVAVCTDASCLTTDSSFSGSLRARARSGVIGELDLQVQAVSGPSLNSGSASATADPFIFVDPAFAGASQYSIVVSPGVGNGIASVPEPESAPLVTLSGGLLLWVAVRRRTSRIPAAFSS